jgi:hypothetical protein
MKLPAHGIFAADIRWMSLIAMVSQNGCYCNAGAIQRHFENLFKAEKIVGGAGCPAGIHSSKLPTSPDLSGARAQNP